MHNGLISSIFIRIGIHKKRLALLGYKLGLKSNIYMELTHFTDNTSRPCYNEVYPFWPFVYIINSM